MFLVILLYMLFASTFTFGKAALTYMQPIMFIGMRMTAAGLLLLGYQYLFNRSKWRIDREDQSTFAAVGFFLMFVSFVAEFWAMQYVRAAKACLLYNLSPFITALFAYMANKITHRIHEQGGNVDLGKKPPHMHHATHKALCVDTRTEAVFN